MFQDVRHGWRLLAREPLLTLAAVATLAFGIGANTAVFSFVDALLLRPFAFERLDELVLIWEQHPIQGGQADVRSATGHRNPVAPADFLDLKRDARAFETLSAFRSRDFVLLGPGGAERLAGSAVTPDFFDALRVPAVQGRTLRPRDVQPGQDAVVVVSHGLWQRRLGGRDDVIGSPLVLDGRSHVVAGVMPAGFAYPPGGVEVWGPLVLSETEQTERSRLSVAVLGRLARGVSLPQARDELARLAAGLEQAHPDSNAGRTYTINRLREQQTGFTAPFAGLFQGAALLVLLLCCSNVGAVLAARSLGRRRELAVRAALGASRARLARQLLAESLVLAVLGALCCYPVARLGVLVIRGAVPVDITKWVYGWSGIGLDERSLLFALGAALLTALATGLAPVLGAAWLETSPALREAGRGTAGGRTGGRTLLVVGEMALALVLALGGGLFVRGFEGMVGRYDGFRPEGVQTFRLRLPADRYPPERVAEFHERLVENLHALPGVDEAAVVSHLPGDLGPMPGGAVSLRGVTTAAERALPVADYQSVSPGYFRTLRVPLLRGRGFDPRDVEDAPPVAIVSVATAERFWPAQDPIGRQLKLGRPDHDSQPWREVVGVVADVTQYWFDAEPRSTLYFPARQLPRANSFVLARSERSAGLVPALRARVAALDPALPLDEVRTLATVVDQGTAILRLAARLLSVLGAVAALLSALGLYALLANDVARRRAEYGLRLAVGAGPGDVRRLVLRRSLNLWAGALAIGAPLAVGLARLTTSTLFGVVALQPWELAAVALALLALTVAATAPAAHAAASLDPIQALRSE